MEWTSTLASEMAGARLPDARLSLRLGRMVERLAVDPKASFPKAMTDSAELEGAYRFFGNHAVTPEGILSGHFEALVERAASEPSVLVVHDSSTFAFSSEGKRAGLGRLASAGQTFFGHVAIVVSDDGLRRPLGVAGLKTWVRADPSESEDMTRGNTLENERSRWGQLVEQTGSLLRRASIIHLMDREADDYTLLAGMIARGDRFIVRCRHDRLLQVSHAATARKLNDAVASIECEVERSASLSKRVDGKRSPIQKKIHPSRSARLARLAIGATTVTIVRSKPLPKTLADSITVNVVRVWEPQPPAGEPGVEWVLLTNEPIDSPQALDRIVERYRARWTIEEFFKALKTGCAYESRQLDNYDALVNALALFAPIALDLLSLRSRARQTPDAHATDFMPAVQIEVLRALGRKPLSARPTIREALLAIAALGGHLVHSGPPGWLTTTRGYLELLTLTRGWEAAREQFQRRCDQR